MAEIKKISTELQPLDKLLDTSGDAGTSGQILTSTGTGTNWVPAGTPGTGVYLPLVGGTLTGPGNLTVSGTATFAGTVLVNSTAVRESASKLSVQGGMSEFETTLTNNNDWENSPISILERANIGSGSTDDKYSPNLNFHWSGRVSNSLWMNDSGYLNYGSYTSAGVPATDGTFKAAHGLFNSSVEAGALLKFGTNGFADIVNIGTGAIRFKPSSQTLALTLTGANATFAGSATATNFITTTDTGIDINGITLTRVAVNSAIRVGDGLETLGLLRSYAGLNVATTGTFGGNITTLAKVGIGTASPQSFTKLDVRSGSANGDNAIVAYAYNGVGGNAITGHGYALDNTHAGSSTGIRGISNGGRTITGSTNVGGQFTASGAANNYAIITTAGNVGINNTTPTFALDVIGTARVSGNTEFPTQSTSDDSSKVATTAFVKNILAEQPAGLSFLGSWNADTNSPTLASGGGELAEGAATSVAANKLNDSNATFQSDSITVDADRVRVVQANGNIAFSVITVVNSNTQLTLTDDIATTVGDTYIVEKSPFLSPEGGYYIVGTSGDEDLNGITDWVVGDWALIATTNVFQKIDNTSVLSGSGNGGSVAGWTGSGTSVTLGDAPITFSSNDSTFAGDLYIPNKIIHVGDPDTWMQFETNVISLRTGGTDRLTLTNSTATFAGDVTTSLRLKSTGADTQTNTTASSGLGIALQNTSDTDGNFIPIDFFNSTGFVTARIGAEFQDAGDRNTDLYFCTRANSGSLTEKMRITSAGNVGIGTASPDAPLHILKAAGGANIVTALKLDPDDATANSGISIDFNASTTNTGASLVGSRIVGARQGGNASGFLALYTSPDASGSVPLERMRIDSAGMVGIGIIPGNGFGLARLSLGTGAVANEIIAFASASGGNAELRNTSSTGTFTFTNSDGSSEKMRINATGNVGIGETSPKAKLNVTGVSGGPTVPVANSSAGIVRIESSNGGVGLDIGAQSASPYSMWMQVGNTSNSSGDTYPILLNPLGGNVGIGTASPASLLHIQGSTYHRVETFFDGDYTSGWKFSDLNGGIKYDAGSDNLVVFSNFTGTGAKMTFETQGSEKMRIDSAGAIKFNAYGAGTLVSDASGNITVSSGGGAGGPFLPLAGNTVANAMTGDINIGDNLGINWYSSTSAYADITLGTDFVINVGKSNADLILQNNSNDIKIQTTSGSSDIYIQAAGDILIDDYIVHNGDTNSYFGFGAADEYKVILNNSTKIAADASSAYLYFEGTQVLKTYGDSSTTSGVTVPLGRLYSFDTDTDTGMFSDLANHIVFLAGNNNILRLESTTSTFSSGGGANGDCTVVIAADTDNTVENSNPILKLQQDGGGAFGHFGLNGEANNTFTGAAVNGTYARASTDFQIVAGSTVLCASFISNGNVGIGTTAPLHALEIYGDAKNIAITNTAETDAGIVFRDAQAATDQAAAIKFNSSDNKLKFFVNDEVAQRMVIDTAGNVGINATSPTKKLYVDGDAYFGDTVAIASTSDYAYLNIIVSDAGNGGTGQGLMYLQNTNSATSGGAMVLAIRNDYGSGFGNYIKFFKTGGSTIGEIYANSGRTNLVYSTSSDYRLKEDLKTFKAVDIINQIPVYDFKWKETDFRDYGVLAHEMQAVLPGLVKGDKDGEENQTVDYMAMVPILMQSIKELKAEIEDLKSKI